MKMKATRLGIMIGVSLFLGLMCVSLGTAFTPLMAVGGPLVCGGGEFGIDSQAYSYKPGQSGTTRHPYCIDGQTGKKKDVTFPLIVVDTLIYGSIVFILLAIVGRKLKASVTRAVASAAAPGATSINVLPGTMTSGRDGVQRLSELKEMRDSNLITDQEYERKKADILKGL